MLLAANSSPISARTRSAGAWAGRSRRERPSSSSFIEIFACARARPRMLSTMAASSVRSVRRKRRRAGVFMNRSSTSMRVPRRGGAGLICGSPPPSTRTSIPASPAKAVCMRRRDTDAMDGSASPRKPCEAIRCRSSDEAILLVAWRFSDSSASCSCMPQPLSSTSMRLRPAFSMRTTIVSAPASRLFSTSSLTTEAGRSTTSPAAIWLATCGGST